MKLIIYLILSLLCTFFTFIQLQRENKYISFVMEPILKATQKKISESDVSEIELQRIKDLLRVTYLEPEEEIKSFSLLYLVIVKTIILIVIQRLVLHVNLVRIDHPFMFFILSFLIIDLLYYKTTYSFRIKKKIFQEFDTNLYIDLTDNLYPGFFKEERKKLKSRIENQPYRHYIKNITFSELLP